MSTAALEPYIYFSGNCREAMEFYRDALGGELEFQSYGDSPGGAEAENPDWLMHASLSGGLAGLMGSDVASASDRAAKVELSLSGTDEDALRKAFDALASGGTVKMALARQFWGATFGSLTDRFGVDWMVNVWPPRA